MAMETICSVCGSNPCYGICPTQDPYQGDQAAENADYEFNAAFDDVRERFDIAVLDWDDDFEYATMPEALPTPVDLEDVFGGDDIPF